MKEYILQFDLSSKIKIKLILKDSIQLYLCDSNVESTSEWINKLFNKLLHNSIDNNIQQLYKLSLYISLNL